jgi:hypothetical protein
MKAFTWQDFQTSIPRIVLNSYAGTFERPARTADFSTSRSRLREMAAVEMTQDLFRGS